MPRKESTDSYWFRFFPDKYLGGTAGFSFEMHGAYLIMLLHQWESGAFKEDIAINKIGNELWNKIKYKFITTDQGLVNVKMDEESKHKRDISEKRTIAVQRRYNSSTIVVQPVYDSVSVSDSSSAFKKVTKKDSDSSFVSFWSIYPKKASKGAAEKAWKKIKNPVETLELIKTALAWQIHTEQWTKEKMKYIPHPATYLNQQNWLDENPKAPEKKPFQNTQLPTDY
jgi:uncharacterized protein YdaU (DUF1376 family)